MKLDAQKLKVEIGDKVFEMDYFTLQEIENLETKEGVAPVKLSELKALIASKGLPIEIVNSLNSLQFRDLMSELGIGSVSKKN